MFVDNTDLNNFHENYLPECLLIPPVTTYHLICATTPVRVDVAKMCKPENTTKERFGAFSPLRPADSTMFRPTTFRLPTRKCTAITHAPKIYLHDTIGQHA